MNIEDNEKDVSEFISVDDLTKELLTCYQMQLDDEGSCKPVFLGKYHEIPLPVSKVMEYKKYKLMFVTYILTQEEIDQKLYKIVGINIFRNGRSSSAYSLDFVYDDETKKFNLIFCEHNEGEGSFDKQNWEVIQTLDNLPEREKIMNHLAEYIFKDPVKGILLGNKRFK